MMEDRSYYSENQVDINIFSVIKGKPKIVDSSILDENYFCHHSIVDKMTKFRVKV